MELTRYKQQIPTSPQHPHSLLAGPTSHMEWHTLPRCTCWPDPKPLCSTHCPNTPWMGPIVPWQTDKPLGQSYRHVSPHATRNWTTDHHLHGPSSLELYPILLGSSQPTPPSEHRPTKPTQLPTSSHQSLQMTTTTTTDYPSRVVLSSPSGDVNSTPSCSLGLAQMQQPLCETAIESS